MAPQPQRQPDAVQEQEQPQWPPVLRAAFRFSVLYFGLFCLTTQVLSGLLPFPFAPDAPPPTDFAWVHQLVFWTAAHIFHLHAVPIRTTGSGDRLYDWLLNFCVLVVAVLGTILWSVLDRKRLQYPGFQKWFRLFIRFALATQLVAYGMAKVVPAQMPFPDLYSLVMPYGLFTPMHVLWSSVGSSPAYEFFAGLAELLAAILLFFPRTATFGAMVALADMIEVFTLNMTYDVPVKLFSFHLILMSLFLLAPEFRRIASFFFSNRAVEPSSQPELFRTPRANRVALGAQAVYGLAILAVNGYVVWVMMWSVFSGGAPRSPLYGIWDVEKVSVDGQAGPPLLTDLNSWRRVVFDDPGGVVFQRPNDAIVYFNAAIDMKNATITLTNGKNSRGVLRIYRPSKEQLTLDGEMDGHQTHLDARARDLKALPLLNTRFHWIQERPNNE